LLDDGVPELVDRGWLERATRPGGELSSRDRHGLEWTLNLAVWIELYRPRIRL